MRNVFASRVDWLYPALDRYGFSRAEICRCLGLAEAVDLPSQVDTREYLALWERLCEMKGDPLLAIHVTEQVELTDLGVIGYLIENAPDLWAVCEILTRYWATLSDSFSMTFETSPRYAILSYSGSAGRDVLMRHEIESTIFGITQAIRDLTTPTWMPSRVNFQHIPVVDKSRYEEIFGQNVHFGQEQNQILFPVHLLGTRRASVDPQLLSLLTSYADQLLASVSAKSDIVSTVRVLTMSRLGKESCSIEAVASTLNVSVRSLQRKLSLAGTSFQKVKDELRAELAMRALSETESSVAEIAQKLGFSESSSFNHTFRRLTGHKPSDYR